MALNLLIRKVLFFVNCPKNDNKTIISCSYLIEHEIHNWFSSEMNL